MGKDKLNEELNDNIEPQDSTEKINETDVTENEKVDSSENLEEKIKQLELELNDYKDRLLRKAAEFENYKRRNENDQLNLLKYAGESFIIKLLPAIDDLERSLAHMNEVNDVQKINEGTQLIYNKLTKALEDQGIKKIESIGQPFNVEYHEALMQRKDESVPEHTVVEELEAGYLYKDRVIRHAKVIVSEDSAS
jgi:molecular chaperone GrpE